MGTNRLFLLKCFVFPIFLSAIVCVDESIFKKCNQSAFCRRLRRFETQQSSFRADLSTLKLSDGIMTVDLLNNATAHYYTLKLSSIHKRIFHFEIDEKHPLSERYRVRDALAQNLQPRRITLDSLESEAVIISDGPMKAVVRAVPFEMEFYLKGELVVSVNSKGLLQFEHLRVKPANPAEGEWQEEFNGFVDTKPRGPESLALDFTFNQAAVLFGIPEHADDFILEDTRSGDPYRLYNLDVNSYVVDSKMALYGSVPVLYGHGPSGSAGVFWQNAAETWVDVFTDAAAAPEANFISESGIIDVFVMLGPSPMETLQQYTFLTGHTPLPQMYALGYHQSRWNYDNDSDVAMIDAKFAEYGIPLDSIWLDIEYTDGKRYFTWDHARFPQPLEMIQNLTASTRHLTIIIDPHVKVDEGYFFHENCSANKYYVKNKDGNDFQGWCWPGQSSYTDFLNPQASKYYADQYLLANFWESSQTVGLWNDMNEPSVFDGPEVTMPKDNKHHGGWEHRDIHNIFGHYHVMATHDGLIARSGGTLRPFVLSRAHFAGTQRYATVWTGDNTAEWSHLQASIKMCLSLSVAGISFCGADVGGFFNNPSAELIGRWYQLGAFQPFFRGHSHEATHRREPWLWPAETQLIIRNAIQKRYRFLPLWYTLFYEHERDGKPIMRPLLARYPTDSESFGVESQYLLGDRLMVAPVLEADQTQVNVYFPRKANGQPDIWYDIDNFQAYNGSGYHTIAVDKHKNPVFQRAGTILSVRNIVRKSTVLMRRDPYTLLVALDAKGRARGTLYVDDEQSFEYRRGRYLYLEIEFFNRVLSLKKVDVNAFYESDVVFDKIIFAGLSHVVGPVRIVTTDGTREKLTIKQEGMTSCIENLQLPITKEWKISFD